MSRKKSVIISRRPDGRSRGAAAERMFAREDALAPFGSIVSQDHREARAKHVDVVPEPTPAMGLLGKVVYGATYGVSYGVVFSVLVVGKLVPGRRIIGQAMTDATAAAKQTFAGLGKRPERAGQGAATDNAPSGIAEKGSLVA